MVKGELVEVLLLFSCQHFYQILIYMEIKVCPFFENRIIIAVSNSVFLRYCLINGLEYSLSAEINWAMYNSVHKFGYINFRHSFVALVLFQY
jgi:hypothetical protein